eukprot:444646_1
MTLILKLFSVICCIELRHCYDLTASGTIDLSKDNGFSQFAAICVGYLATTNFLASGIPAGAINISFTAPINAPHNTTYMLVAYDDQEYSFPIVNNTDMTCQEKVYGYYRLKDTIRIEPGHTRSLSINLHEHIRTRWWWFYLVNCNVSMTFVPISYTYSYKDTPNDTEICTIKPNNASGVTTSIPTIGTNIITTIPSGSGSGSIISSGGATKILKWALIGVIVIVIVVIGLCVAFRFKYRKKQEIIPSEPKENLLMNSLNEQDISGNVNVNVYDLLEKWCLQEYGKVLVEEKGYDDVEIWKDLNETDLNEMGFKQSHSKKFVKMVNEYFMHVLVEKDVFNKEKYNED